MINDPDFQDSTGTYKKEIFGRMQIYGWKIEESETSYSFKFSNHQHEWKISKDDLKATKESLALLTTKDFVQLDKKMLTDDEQEFDLLWKEMKSRLYFTIQSKGIEYYSLEDRSNMATSLEFHVSLNSEYVTQKHGTSIRGVVKLLEWAEMYDYMLENNPNQSLQKWKDSILKDE